MNFLKSTLFFLLFTVCSAVAQPQKYSRVKIWTDDAGLRKLSSLGLETDHGDIRKGVWLISDFSTAEIEKIQQAGFRTDVLIDDVQEHYRNSNSAPASGRVAMPAQCNQFTPSYPVPSNFSLGSMGGYFTYQEMLDNLDSMASKYPGLITIKSAIPGGTTLENRPIYWVKISDNPLVDETEPEMLYTAVHHAREPGGMSQLIYYMWYLLENYSAGGELATLVDNTEMFFVPCINPDGYIYNETTDPSGGGMWRKNRRNNLDGSFGVDLNRNYGYNWGFDDNGSSPNGFDETYRGTAGFSEPETQLISSFVNSREFRIALNYHTFGNLLIYPWGYDYSIYTPDSALFSDYGKLLTTYNAYTAGTADQTVGYVVNGSSDDWMYGEQLVKPKVFAMTPETGESDFGFWPPQSEIIRICQLNMFQNITAAQLCGRYAIVEETSSPYVSQYSNYFNYNFKQLGLDTTGTYQVSLTPLTTNISQVGNPVTYTGLALNQTVADSISFSLITPMNNGDAIRFLVTIDNGLFTKTDTIEKFFGNPQTAFYSDCNSTVGWVNSFWGNTSTYFYSPTASITDSPFGYYLSNEFNTITLANNIDLTNAVKANLSFYARWEIEPNYDYVMVRITTNNGVTWTPLCGKYTVEGVQNQAAGEPLYEGFQFDWVKEEINLDAYVGNNVKIGFLLVSDGFLEFDGFYFDEVTVDKIVPGTNSIQENASIPSFSLMPNPASGYVYVNLEVPSSGKEIIKIHDMSGRLVAVQQIAAGTTSVRTETAAFAKGIYTVELVSEHGESRPVKLVIQ